MIRLSHSNNSATGTSREQPGGQSSYLEAIVGGVKAAVWPDEEQQLQEKREQAEFVKAMQGVKKI